MRYLYGSKHGGGKKLAATFDSEQQLLAYVRWATLQETGKHDGLTEGKFEQGSALAGYRAWILWSLAAWTCASFASRQPTTST